MVGRIAFEVDEGRAIGNDVLHILHVGDIKAGIEDLAGYPFGHREPDLAVEAGRRPDSKLVSRCP
jgi:hypothetical protein